MLNLGLDLLSLEVFMGHRPTATNGALQNPDIEGKEDSMKEGREESQQHDVLGVEKDR